jgi:hypothetical protein
MAVRALAMSLFSFGYHRFFRPSVFALFTVFQCLSVIYSVRFPRSHSIVCSFDRIGAVCVCPPHRTVFARSEFPRRPSPSHSHVCSRHGPFQSPPVGSFCVSLWDVSSPVRLLSDARIALSPSLCVSCSAADHRAPYLCTSSLVFCQSNFLCLSAVPAGHAAPINAVRYIRSLRNVCRAF